MVDVATLLDLFFTFARMALTAFGGMQAVLPEVYREVVEVRGWMSAADLADLIALAQAAPGPNGLFAALIGWRIAGTIGFLVSAAAVALPPAILAFAMARLRRRLANARWLRLIQSGLMPVVVGLILAGGLVSAQAADDTPVKIGLTTLVALVVWRTRWNPLWLLGVGALVGFARI
jgi:chromate transporter